MVISVKEPSPSGVIVSALEIVITSFGVVVISTVAEGVIAENEVIAGGI